jgi:hypothetical protein
LLDSMLISEDRAAFLPAQAIEVDRSHHVTA